MNVLAILSKLRLGPDLRRVGSGASGSSRGRTGSPCGGSGSGSDGGGAGGARRCTVGRHPGLEAPISWGSTSPRWESAQDG
jgi:hypothetical protein